MSISLHSIWSVIKKLIPIGALVVSIFVVIRSCHHNKIIFEHEYKIDALSRRPLLKLIEKFQIDSIQLDNIGIASPPVESLIKFQPGFSSAESLILTARIKIMGHIKMCNKGNDVASVISHFILTKNSTDDVMRDVLLGNYRGKMEWIADSTDYYFEIIDIPPDDSFTFPYVTEIRQASDPYEIVLHFFVLYENQFGALFDTYCWFRLQFIGISDPEILIGKSKKQINLYFPSKYILDMFKITESASSYYSYDKKQKEKVLSIMEHYEKENSSR